jgi:hypothetical protein
MALYTHSGTTGTNTVATVSFTNWQNGIEIVNTGTVDLWARVDGVTPVVAADDNILIPARSFVTVTNISTDPAEPAIGYQPGTTVLLISSAPTTYTVSVGV